MDDYKYWEGIAKRKLSPSDTTKALAIYAIVEQKSTDCQIKNFKPWEKTKKESGIDLLLITLIRS